MKTRLKITVGILLIMFQLSYSVYASENGNSDENSNITVNVGVGTLFPLSREWSTGEKILGSALTASLSTGVGYHFNIVDDIFSPGIYGDFHISLLSKLLSIEDEDGEEYIFLTQLGIRMYNQFRVNSFDIEPFIGLNFMFNSNWNGLFNKFGILIAYNNIGIEYSYHHRLTGDKIFNGINRVLLVYHY